jgi:nicotinamide mononucleotide (NMN) deamidase PncC
VDSTTRHFAGDREAVRRASVIVALQGVVDRVQR